MKSDNLLLLCVSYCLTSLKGLVACKERFCPKNLHKLFCSEYLRKEFFSTLLVYNLTLFEFSFHTPVIYQPYRLSSRHPVSDVLKNHFILGFMPLAICSSKYIFLVELIKFNLPEFIFFSIFLFGKWLPPSELLLVISFNVLCIEMV